MPLKYFEKNRSNFMVEIVGQSLDLYRQTVFTQYHAFETFSELDNRKMMKSSRLDGADEEVLH